VTSGSSRLIWEFAENMLLELQDVEAGYGKKKVLNGVSFNLAGKELLAMVGPNGAGKTTALRVISGQIHPFRGKILFNDQDISQRPAFSNVRHGISVVPQGGKVFKPLTVLENLEMGGYLLSRREEVEKSVEQVCNLFPILRDRKTQMASTLSGGEQQMLAIARGLMLKPQILLLDEPSLGLAPLVLRNLMKAIVSVKEQIKSSIIIVEQNVNEVLKIADRVYVMKLGRIVFQEESPERLLLDEKLRKAYLT
jgi:branched-chain amino acid transport system ATP-binding protein